MRFEYRHYRQYDDDDDDVDYPRSRELRTQKLKSHLLKI